MATNIEKIKNNVKNYLDEKRYAHVERVVKCASELAKKYNVDIEKAEASAWLHDIGKFFELSVMQELVKGKYPEIKDENSTAILHGFAGAEFVRENYSLFEIDDEEILDGIKYHTIGSGKMSLLARIVYLADAIEEGRNWDGVEKVRELAGRDLNEALKYEIDSKLVYLISEDTIIHPNIILFRNALISERK